jgi:hypothetical protein
MIKNTLEQKLWLNGIDGVIPGDVSVQDFATVLNSDPETAWKMLQELSQHDIGKFDGNVSEFVEGDKLRATIFALKKGALVDEAAKHLNWRDFEALTAHILEMKDFATMKNLILTEPRNEIDVVGVKFGIAMLIDCKHWKKHSQSALEEAVRKQIERTKHYVAKTKGAIAAPVIVTLYQDKVSFINSVPIVPIFQFASFVDEFYGNLEDVEVIRKESQ